MDLPTFSLPLLSMQQLLLRLVAALVVVSVHGFTAALVADRLGDHGPRLDGRRTFSPVAHLDLIGVAHALFFRLVWMPKLDLDASRLRGERWGAALVVVAASMSLALLSAVALGSRTLVLTFLQGSAALTVSSVLTAVSDLAIVAAAFHLLPIPPLLGAAWAPWAVRRDAWWHGTTARFVGIGLLILASSAGGTERVARPLIAAWRAAIGF